MYSLLIFKKLKQLQQTWDTCIFQRDNNATADSTLIANAVVLIHCICAVASAQLLLSTSKVESSSHALQLQMTVLL